MFAPSHVLKFWKLSVLALCLLVLPACSVIESPELSAEEAVYLEEASLTAEEMFELRRDAVLDENTRDVLKDMYLEHGYTRKGTPATNVYYIPKRIKSAQQFLGGIESVERDRGRVYTKNNAVEVQLKYNVFGYKNNTTEWVKLRQKPDNSQWMLSNDGRFVIVSHQIRM